MKKFYIIVMLAILCVGVFQAPVAAGSNIKLYLNNVQKFTTPEPFIDRQTNRTFVPLRFIAENFGADVDWIASEKKVIITQPGGTTINLFINNPQAIVNGSYAYLDAAPRIVNNRTVVPLRFVAENLDLDVYWNGGTRTISIFSKGTAINPPASSAVKTIVLPDGIKINISLLNGWQYQDGNPSTGMLFLLNHESGASINIVIENLSAPISRADYIASAKGVIARNYGVENFDEEDLGNNYNLGYTVSASNGEYYIAQTLIFPTLDTNYMLDEYVGIRTTTLPTSLTSEQAQQVFEDGNAMITFE